MNQFTRIKDSNVAFCSSIIPPEVDCPTEILTTRTKNILDGNYKLESLVFKPKDGWYSGGTKVSPPDFYFVLLESR